MNLYVPFAEKAGEALLPYLGRGFLLPPAVRELDPLPELDLVDTLDPLGVRLVPPGDLAVLFGDLPVLWKAAI